MNYMYIEIKHFSIQTKKNYRGRNLKQSPCMVLNLYFILYKTIKKYLM